MTGKALLLVDLQNDYYPGGKWPLEGIELASANAVRLLAASREAGDLVVHVRHEFASAEAPFFVAGSEGAETHADVRPATGEAVVLKAHANSFRDTDLHEILTGRGIEEVVICGAMSHMCIDAATRAAADLGFACTLVHDACATRDLAFQGIEVPAAMVHAAFMAALGSSYAKVISTAEYLAGSAKAA